MFSKNFRVDYIDDYRVQLLGIAAVCILCVHSISIIEFNQLLHSVMGIGSIGIYMFSFLSGRGLSYSMARESNIRLFYFKRIKRVFVPYLIISLIWYYIKYFLLCFDPFSFLEDLSTLSFWTRGSGAWYVAFLFPVYLLFPMYYFWTRKRGLIKTFLLIFVSYCLEIFLYFCFYESYVRYSQVLMALISFFIGTISVYQNTTDNIRFHINRTVLFLSMIGSFLFFLPLFRNNEILTGLSVMLAGVFACYFFAFCLKHVKIPQINYCFGFLGKISLESYLTNIYLLQAYVILKTGIQSNMYSIFAYLTICFLGICLAWIVSLFTRGFKNRKNSR